MEMSELFYDPPAYSILLMIYSSRTLAKADLKYQRSLIIAVVIAL